MCQNFNSSDPDGTSSLIRTVRIVCFCCDRVLRRHLALFGEDAEFDGKQTLAGAFLSGFLSEVI